MSEMLGSAAMPAGGSIDETATRGFHLRMSAFVGGGQFIDGYILGVVAIALVIMPAGFGLTPVWKGLIGSSALIGTFIGSIIFGWLADHVGRKNLYTMDLSVFLAGSVLQFFVVNPWQLFTVRLVVGIAIGVDYAVGPTYLAEFAPRRSRGRLLGSLAGMWAIGYSASLAVGVIGAHWGHGAWRWVLASSAIPAVVVLVLRIGSPESPRWLVRKGRLEEARAVCRKYIGPHVSVDDLLAESNIRPSYRKLLSGIWLRRVIFVGVFWSALAWPEFAIFTFLPTLLTTLHIHDANLGSLLIRLMTLPTFGLGMYMMGRMGRRPMLISALLLCTVIFAVLAIPSASASWLIVLLFCLFALVLGFVSNLEFLYPAELFPTDIRASGVGLGSAGSRVGAAAGTFLLPVLLAGPGLHFAMFVTALVTTVGAVVTLRWAPETGGRTLYEASTGLPATTPAPAVRAGG
jgi:MFS transporter, putative metabolite transport protein